MWILRLPVVNACDSAQAGLVKGWVVQRLTRILNQEYEDPARHDTELDARHGCDRKVMCWGRGA